MPYREWLQSELTALRKDGEIERERQREEEESRRQAKANLDRIKANLDGMAACAEAKVGIEERLHRERFPEPDETIEEGRRKASMAAFEHVFKVNPDEHIGQAAGLSYTGVIRRKAIAIARSKFDIPEGVEVDDWQITQVWLQAKNDLLAELWDRDQKLIAMTEEVKSKGDWTVLNAMLTLILDGATHA